MKGFPPVLPVKLSPLNGVKKLVTLGRWKFVVSEIPLVVAADFTASGRTAVALPFCVEVVFILIKSLSFNA